MTYTRAESAYHRAGYNMDPTRFLPKYYISVSLGQANDFTALAVIRTEHYAEGHTIEPRDRILEVPVYERIPLRTPYTDIVKYVSKMYRDVKVGKASETYPILEITDCGRQVADVFTKSGLEHTAVNLVMGHDVTRGNAQGEVNVPKIDVVQALHLAFQMKRVRIDEGNPLVKTLKNKLFTYTIKRKLATLGMTTLEMVREGNDDDLVLALATGVWAATCEDFDYYTPFTGPTVRSLWFPR